MSSRGTTWRGRMPAGTWRGIASPGMTVAGHDAAGHDATGGHRIEPVTTAMGALQRGMWLWDVLFASATIGTVVLVALAAGPLAARVGAAALVVICGAGWPLFARRIALLDRDRGSRPAPAARAALLYCAGLGVALVLAVLLVPAANWAAFVVVSQLFWLLPLPPAITGALLLTLALPVGVSVLRAEPLGVLGPQLLFIAGFGVLVGVFIHRIADESARRGELIAQLRRTQEEMAQLSHRAGVAAERERLAGEIHDTLAQGFTSIVTLLQAAQTEFDADAPAARRHVALAVRAARENLQEARQLVAATAPAFPAEQSLPDAIGRQVDRFAEDTGVDAEHGTSGPPRRLPAEQEVVLLRAAQELLTNVARHAGASTVTVRLDLRDPATVALVVADDGAGFDPARVGTGSYGLAMMRSRVERLGGRLELDTAPGTGTTATVTMPAP